MRRPRRVKIGAFWYSVSYVRSIGGGCVGLCHYHSKTISVRTQLKPRMLAQTLLHEIMHGIYYEFGVTNSEQTDADYIAGMASEESAVNGISNGLMQVLVDNPGFRRFLVAACR